LHVANQTETLFQLIDKGNVGGKQSDCLPISKSKLTTNKIIMKRFYSNIGFINDNGNVFTSCESLKYKQNAESKELEQSVQ
jgi:hypothetical protein